ncbi:centrosomal protein of 192 kDa-like isoform X2 [Corticium candelabrum]|uniref:centrosomal protein of 192 kDa-like isoform X2 n=1 Tax=Corticium candelabrum TaxID=121492 RepID=UPI002E26856C|nr:centrosomal protein of 192 kDa-like isoform X2 [Corticium candelabrum]
MKDTSNRFDGYKTQPIGRLYVYYVDEYSRVRFKRALETCSSDFQPVHLPKGLGSMVDFEVNESVAEEVVAATNYLETEEQVLLSQLSDICIILTGSTKTELSPFEWETVQTRRVESDDRAEGERLDGYRNWYVTPQEIIVPARSKTVLPRETKVHLFSKSDRLLRFNIFWPKQLLTVSPDKGFVEPQHRVTILVSHRIGSMKHQLPWLGSMTIYCDGLYEAIRVQVRRGLIVDSPVQAAGTALKSIENKRLSEELPSVEKQGILGKTKQSDDTRKEKCNTVRRVQRVVVEETEVMTNKATMVDVDLEVAERVEWRLWSVVPVYVKVEDSDNLMRATYAVFHFSHTSGSCAGGDKLKLLVSFRPRGVGVYSQTWELEYGNKKSPWKNKCRLWLALSGLGVPSRLKVASGHGVSNGNGIAPHTEKGRVLSAPQGLMYSKASRVEFSHVQTREVQIKVGNRSRDDDLVIMAYCTPPFKPSHDCFIVRSRRYVQLGILYLPDKPTQACEGLLHLRLKDMPSELLQVQLKVRGK